MELAQTGSSFDDGSLARIIAVQAIRSIDHRTTEHIPPRTASRQPLLNRQFDRRAGEPPVQRAVHEQVALESLISQVDSSGQPP